MAEFVHPLRVRFGECDMQGIVFNAHYLLYFDVAFTELWRAALGAWTEMAEHGLDMVVAETHLSFRSPARYDDEIDLALSISRLGRTGIRTEYEVRRGGEVLADGWLRHVCVSTETWAKAEMPPWMRAGLARFAREGAEQPVS